MNLVGTTLAGRYDLLEMLGAGGMGEVYRARDRELDELVALKLIRSDLASAPDMVARFRHEVKLARRVTHASVARTFELGQADGAMYCTMQLVEGESLAQRLERERRLSIGDAATIACTLCEALVAAHDADVIHRDIKPANVLIALDGRAVLADFGIAAVRVGDADASGTPAYMAPEQMRGEPPTPATDVYAVGVVLHEMVTGHRAFHGAFAAVFEAKQRVEHLAVTTPDVGHEFAEVIARATARDPSARIATAADLGHALAPWRKAIAPSRLRRRPSHPAMVHERSVLVVAPTAVADELAPIAEAIHEELLAALGRTRLHVLSRTEPGEAPDLVARFTVEGDLLAMAATRPGEDAPATTLQLPLAVAHVGRSVALAMGAITTLLGGTHQPVGDEPYELFVRARHLARRGPTQFRDPRALLERAIQLDPDDMRIRADLASILMRSGFFGRDREPLERATEHVRVALARGANLVETHLAAGHLQIHTGDPVAAAAHYRQAIACAPHSAEAHDQLGRVLLEAGYLDAALARFERATAISPRYRIVRWEIARAMALEQNWDECDRLLAGDDLSDRPIAAARLCWWRGDAASTLSFRADAEAAGLFDADFLELLFATFIDHAWARARDVLIGKAEDRTLPSHRRRAFVAQLVAEAAGFAGDIAACNHILAVASRGAKVFDLHWLDRCPLLATVRGTADFAVVRGEVQARARAIYDALYSDHAVAHGETALATALDD